MNPSSSFWSGRRVLLTGHTGFKGSWCALWLQKLGAEVYGLSLAPEGESPLWNALGEPATESFIGDIRDRDVVARAFAKAQPDIVLHMAAQALVHPSYEDPATTFETNVMGLVNVLDGARAASSVHAVVNVTSDKCYENREQIWAYREDDPMGGSDPYSASKGCAELVTSSYRRSFFNKPDGARLASGRAGNVIGGGDYSADRLAPDTVRAFQAGKRVMIRNPLSTRPWQHVLEPISGYLVLAERLFVNGAAVAEGWNFGPPDEDAWPVSDVVDRLAAAWGGEVGWDRDPTVRPHEAMLLRVDASKARARLGWKPRLRIGDALDWTVEWAKAVDDGESSRSISLRQLTRYEALGQTTQHAAGALPA